jgi:hypothetical protein
MGDTVRTVDTGKIVAMGKRALEESLVPTIGRWAKACFQSDLRRPRPTCASC